VLLLLLLVDSEGDEVEKSTNVDGDNVSAGAAGEFNVILLLGKLHVLSIDKQENPSTSRYGDWQPKHTRKAATSCILLGVWCIVSLIIFIMVVVQTDVWVFQVVFCCFVL
jgi:hypothetical protein